MGKEPAEMESSVSEVVCGAAAGAQGLTPCWAWDAGPLGALAFEIRTALIEAKADIHFVSLMGKFRVRHIRMQDFKF